MGKSRAERRERSGLVVNLFSANTVLGWEVVRTVAVELALEKVALKQWREVFYDTGELAGVQPFRQLKADERKTRNQVLIERLIAVAITAPEVKRNAGLYGRSRTTGLAEWKRLRRHPMFEQVKRLAGEERQRVPRHSRFDESRILPPEDEIERAVEKVKLWPYPASVLRDERGDAVRNGGGRLVFADRAVRVYPRAGQTVKGRGDAG